VNRLNREPHHSSVDLVLGGGGAIGLAIAWEAAKRGMKVRLLERKTLGSGASWAGAGILPPGARKSVFDPLEQLRAESHLLFPAWCESLAQESGIDPGFRRCGGFYLARTAAEFATLVAQEAWWEEHGIEFERLSASEVPTRIPSLNSSAIRSAWFLPDECQVRNPRYIDALAIACQRRGVLIHEHEAASEFIYSDHGTPSVRTAKGEYQASRICITSGAWTPLISSELQSQLDIFPVRGQMVLFKLPKRDLSSIVNEGHRYLVPRDDGYVLAGSCEEEVGYDERTTDEMIESLKQWAIELAPMLRQAPVEKSWSGLRPASVDGFPYLGELPHSPNMFVAAGHYRHGLHLSPITAHCMVDLMTGIQPSCDLRPFGIMRGKTYRIE
jgi:glycine oxidase